MRGSLRLTSPRGEVSLPARRAMRYTRAMRIVLVTALLLASASAYADPAKATDTKGTDYGPQVRAMFRVAACGSDDAVPDRFSVHTVDSHCKEMQEVYKSYKHAWADAAQRFIAELRPKDLTHTVVYPFGGGDLSSALAVYPDADGAHHDLARGRRRHSRDRHDHQGAARDRPRHDHDRYPPPVSRGTLDDEEPAGGFALGVAGYDHDGDGRPRRARHGADRAALLRHRVRRHAALSHERRARLARGRLRGGQARYQGTEEGHALLVRARLRVRRTSRSSFARAATTRQRCARIATSSRTSTTRT